MTLPFICLFQSCTPCGVRHATTGEVVQRNFAFQSLHPLRFNPCTPHGVRLDAESEIAAGIVRVSILVPVFLAYFICCGFVISFLRIANPSETLLYSTITEQVPVMAVTVPSS